MSNFDYSAHPRRAVANIIFSLHRILTIGPSFQLNARALATVDLDLGLAVDIAYKVENTKVFFPPQKGQKSSGSAVPQNSREFMSV